MTIPSRYQRRTTWISEAVQVRQAAWPSNSSRAASRGASRACCSPPPCAAASSGPVSAAARACPSRPGAPRGHRRRPKDRSRASPREISRRRPTPMLEGCPHPRSPRDTRRRVQQWRWCYCQWCWCWCWLFCESFLFFALSCCLTFLPCLACPPVFLEAGEPPSRGSV